MDGAPSDSLRDVYERRAELEYARPVPAPDPLVDRKFERISELVRAELPCASFLDAGCGDGRYLPLLAAVEPRPERIAGSDISQRILETARATAAAAGIEPELVQANLESLPFPDGSFELVLCTQVIEHLLDPAAGARELARVLAPGGTLVLSTDNAHARVTKLLAAPRTALVRLLGLQGRRQKVHFPHAEFTRAQVEALVTGAGLGIRELGTFRFSAPPPLNRPAAQRLLGRLDRSLPPHGVGDIVYVVAAKPG